jgi:transposase InsO family protein
MVRQGLSERRALTVVRMSAAARRYVPLADRQPLVRPQAPNEVWSADFVFDRTAEGRVLKCLTIVAVVPARALDGCCAPITVPSPAAAQC